MRNGVSINKTWSRNNFMRYTNYRKNLEPEDMVAIRINGNLHPETIPVSSIKGEYKKGGIIEPFLQSYKYKVVDIHWPNPMYEMRELYPDVGIFTPNFGSIIDVEPYCDNAKAVFQRQYGSSVKTNNI